MKLAITAFISAFLLTACIMEQPRQQTEPGPDGVIHELQGTRWALTKLGDKAIAIGENSREPYIVLGRVDDGVVGHAGCNRISSTYKLNGKQLSFGEVIATKMFCDDIPTETALLNALKIANQWQISGSQLQLLDSRQMAVATFEARDLQ